MVDEHRQYLADEPRIDAFRRAISATVHPGDVVLDLGAGTGIFGLLAAQAGASHIYSIEASSLIGLGRQIVAANGWSDRFRFIRGYSTNVELPEQVDVVVADQIGRFGFEAGVFEYFSDARRRFLKPGGVTIPKSVSLWAAPVENPAQWDNVDFWSGLVCGFDMRPARTIATNTGYPLHLDASSLLASPELLLSAHPDQPVIDPWRMEAAFLATRAGTLHGIGGWFEAELSPGVTMTNSPLAPNRINRRNVFFPIDEAIPVSEGDRIELAMVVSPDEIVVSWTVTIRSGAGPADRHQFRHSTWNGILLSKEDLRRTSPDTVPVLTARGQARATVLELCDGKTNLGTVQREVYRRHQSLFRGERDAELFVAEVVTRYST